MKDAEKTLAKAREAVTTPMAPEVLASAQSMLDWLIYSAIADGGRHIAMETAEPAAAAPVRAADTPVEGSDEGMIAELERKLSFEYPYADAGASPVEGYGDGARRGGTPRTRTRRALRRSPRPASAHRISAG
ncbi:MAG: hypothetical protein V8S72_02415 [Oscillospiraceae bacterium]